MEIKNAYQKSGVDYSLLDPVKISAQKSAAQTADNLRNTGFNENKQSRGESAYIIESADCYYASVIEGLGTKNLLGDYYSCFARDTVAMIVNDLITVGAMPLVISAYWAVGDPVWFRNKKRVKELVSGWKKACDASGATWGGGETPVLKKIIYPGAIELAGSAFGIVKPKNNIISSDKIRSGDDIIFFASSGIHANGLTLARKILAISKNKEKILRLLLKPTVIYAKVIRAIQSAGIEIHYLVNITGHGWRKLMRANDNFTYEINNIGDVPEIFKIIKIEGGLSDREMYSTFNMGAGFSLITNPANTRNVLAICSKFKIKAWRAGIIKKGEKQVNILPLGLTYYAEDLRIRN